MINGGKFKDKALASIYRARGSWKQKKGELDASLADYDISIRIEPDNVESYDYRADVYQQQGDFDKALDDYDHATRIDPTYAAAYFSRGRIYEKKGDIAKARVGIQRGDRGADQGPYRAMGAGQCAGTAEGAGTKTPTTRNSAASGDCSVLASAIRRAVAASMSSCRRLKKTSLSSPGAIGSRISTSTVPGSLRIERRGQNSPELSAIGRHGTPVAA